MATKVLDLEIEELPATVDGLAAHEQALILFRFRGHPVGRAWLPVKEGCIERADLEAAVAKSVDWPLWEAWLHDYLNLDERAPASAAPGAAPGAVCTRDRPADLERCLEALLRLPDDGQEILIVDNCPSTDATYRLVRKYPRVRCVREDQPGLNAARNRAMREARHEIVVFNDDDAMPEPGWLRALLRNFDDERVLCVTGLTMPVELETTAQEWFERYSPFQRGFKRVVYDMTELHPLAAGKVGAGANMALRRSATALVGPFDEALDAGTPTRSGGDTDMFARILAAGYRLVYDPEAVSWHRHRRTWEELRQTIYGYGVGAYAIWTRKLFFEKELAVPLFALNWFWRDQLPSLIRSLVRWPGSAPLDLPLAELRGCLAGPAAYLTSRKKLEKEPKRYGLEYPTCQRDYPHP